MEITSYLQFRAAAEGVAFGLDDAFFTGYMEAGARQFFGITVDDGGVVLSDEQSPDTLAAWRRQSFH